MKKYLSLTILLLFVQSVMVIRAQENINLDKKLKKIKGDIEKIIIKTSDDEIVFEDEEAEHLLNKLKSSKKYKLEWVSEDDDDTGEDNIFIFKSDSGKHIIKKIIQTDHENIVLDGDSVKNINVEVEEENGEKKVVITKTINGQESVEEYHGEEAEKKLKELNDEGNIVIDIDVEDVVDGENVFMFKNDGGDEIEKEVKVELKNGKKRVTETITKDGKTVTKVYKGDEAEKYWKTSEGKKIKIKKLKGAKGKKIMIKEVEIDDED